MASPPYFQGHASTLFMSNFDQDCVSPCCIVSLEISAILYTLSCITVTQLQAD